MFGKRKKRREAIRNKLREKSEYKMKSENVAIPEIHTKDFDEIEEHIDEIEQEKEEKQEKNRQSAIKKAEALEEANIRSRTMDHKKGMIEALTAQERTEYDLKHEENLIQKEQLKQALLAQKKRLLNIQNEELEAKPKSR